MGRTVPTYRLAMEQEILSWAKGYRKALRRNDKEIFDRILNKARIHGDAGTMSGRPVIFEVMVMSIILEQQKQLREVQKQLIKLQNKLDEQQDVNNKNIEAKNRKSKLKFI